MIPVHIWEFLFLSCPETFTTPAQSLTTLFEALTLNSVALSSPYYLLRSHHPFWDPVSYTHLTLPTT